MKLMSCGAGGIGLVSTALGTYHDAKRLTGAIQWVQYSVAAIDSSSHGQRLEVAACQNTKI